MKLVTGPEIARTGDYLCERCDHIVGRERVHAAFSEMIVRRCPRCDDPMAKVVKPEPE